MKLSYIICSLQFTGLKDIGDTSDGFGLEGSKFSVNYQRGFPASLNLIGKEDTEDVAIEDPDLGVNVKCYGSPNRLQHYKGLVCLADSGVDFSFAVARYDDFVAEVSKLINILYWFAVDKYWISVGSVYS